LQHKFLDQKAIWSFDADYAKTQRIQDNHFENQFFQANGSLGSETESLLNEQQADLTITAFRTDVSYRFTDQTKLEVGWSYSDTPLDFDNNFFQILASSLTKDDFFSNQLNYEERIQAAYGSFHFRYLGIQFQTGLRLESTNANVDQRDGQPNNKLKYTNLFPSIFLTKAFAKKHQLNINFGRRIDRPNYIDLSPYRRFISYYTHIAGNPTVSPQFTNTYALNYTFLPKNINVNVNYNRTVDLLSFLPSQNDSTRIELVKRTNIDRRDQWSLSFSTPFNIWSNSNGQVNINLLSTTFNGAQVDYSRPNNRFSYTLNANQRLRVGELFNLNLAFQYFSKAFYGFILAQDRWQLNLALSKKVWKQRMHLQIGVDDMFNQNFFLGHLEYNNLDVRFDNRWESRMIKASIRFNVGDQGSRPFSGKSGQAEARLKRL